MFSKKNILWGVVCVCVCLSCFLWVFFKAGIYASCVQSNVHMSPKQHALCILIVLARADVGAMFIRQHVSKMGRKAPGAHEGTCEADHKPAHQLRNKSRVPSFLFLFFNKCASQTSCSQAH